MQKSHRKVLYWGIAGVLIVLFLGLMVQPVWFLLFILMDPFGGPTPPPEYDKGYTIQMRVVDIETGQPLENIEVNARGFTFSAQSGLPYHAGRSVSDADGFLTLALPVGGEVDWEVYDESSTYHVRFRDTKMRGSLASPSINKGNHAPNWMKLVEKDGDFYWEISLFKMRQKQEVIIPASTLNQGQTFTVIYRSVGAQDSLTKRVPETPEVIVHNNHGTLGPHVEVRHHFSDWIMPKLQLANGEIVSVKHPWTLNENTKINLQENQIALYELYHPEDSYMFGHFGGFPGYLGGTNDVGRSQRVPYYYGHYKDALRMSRDLAEYDYSPGGNFDQMQKDARVLLKIKK